MMNTQLAQLAGMIRYEFLMQWRRKTMIVVLAPLLLMFVFFALLSAEQVRSQAQNAITSGLSATEVQRALTLTLIPAVWAVLHIMIILVTPIAVSDTIPKDRQLGMRELLDTVPLSSGVYVAGKLLSMWLVLLAGLGGVAVLTGLLWLVVFGSYDVATYAAVWAFLAAPLALANPGIAMLLAAGQPNRRRAVTVGFIVTVLTIFTLQIGQSLTIWDYLSPFRPVLFKYWIQGGASRLGMQPVAQGDVYLSVAAAIVEVVLVAVGTWVFLRRQRDA